MAARIHNRPVLAFVATMAAITAAPIALAAYAQSRPIGEAICTTTRDVLWAEPQLVEVRTCRVAGVEVGRTVTPLQTQEAR